MNVAALGRRGRVHVAVRVDPDETRAPRRGSGRNPPMAPTEPAASEWSPPRVIGSAPAAWDSIHLAGRAADRPARSRGCTASSGPARSASRGWAPPGRPCRRLSGPHRREPLAEPGNPDGRRPHVDTRDARAEVERHPEDMDGAAGSGEGTRENYGIRSRSQVSACGNRWRIVRITVAVISLSGLRLTRNRADDLISGRPRVPHPCPACSGAARARPPHSAPPAEVQDGSSTSR